MLLTTAVAYIRSLLWTVLCFAIYAGASNTFELIVVDFVHGNPHRPQSNAIEMMLIFTPLLGLIALIGAALAFTVPQCFQALIDVVTRKRLAGCSNAAIIAALPITAVLTWYSWDYLTPSDVNLGINVGPDWQPYQHGLSWSRYTRTLALQAPVTLFSLLYANAYLAGRSKLGIILAALFISIIAGTIWGIHSGLNQFQFLSRVTSY